MKLARSCGFPPQLDLFYGLFAGHEVIGPSVRSTIHAG